MIRASGAMARAGALVAIAIVGIDRWAGGAAPATPPSGTVVLKVLGGEETGLKKIMEDWARQELERQGGKYGDHGWWLWGLTAFDFDNDGAIDLMPSHHGPSGALILRNTLKETGKLTFVNVTSELGVDGRQLPQGMGLRPPAMDLDGDGWLDLVGVRSPHFYNQQGRKLVPVGTKNFDTIHPSAIEDLDGDGLLDILDGHQQWLFDPASRAFKAKPYADPAEARVPAEVMNEIDELKAKVRFWSYRCFTDVDLDGDGINDVALGGFGAYSGSPLGRYLIGDEAGKLVDRTEALGLPRDATPILVMDLDRDGRVEVLAAYGKSAGLFVGDGRGKYVVKAGPVTDFVRRPGPYLHRATPVDFNDDGRMDLVVSNPRYGTEEIYENLGAGDFKLLAKAGGWDSDPVAVCDINDDGLIDVVVGGPKDTITIYLNQTPKPGRSCNILPRMSKPNPFAAGAVAEVFKAGELGQAGARPLLREKARADGAPVHVGLGTADRFDLRVTFPGKDPKVVEVRNVEAKGKWHVRPDGTLREKAE